MLHRCGIHMVISWNESMNVASSYLNGRNFSYKHNIDMISLQYVLIYVVLVDQTEQNISGMYDIYTASLLYVSSYAV